MLWRGALFWRCIILVLTSAISRMVRGSRAPARRKTGTPGRQCHCGETLRVYCVCCVMSARSRQENGKTPLVVSRPLRKGNGTSGAVGSNVVPWKDAVEHLLSWRTPKALSAAHSSCWQRRIVTTPRNLASDPTAAQYCRTQGWVR